MIRDIRWAYELGFKRGWKVGNRRGRNASKTLIQSDLIKGCDHVYFRREESNEEDSWDLVEIDNAYCPKCGEKL
jgi:hypothetical protein